MCPLDRSDHSNGNPAALPHAAFPSHHGFHSLQQLLHPPAVWNSSGQTDMRPSHLRIPESLVGSLHDIVIHHHLSVDVCSKDFGSVASELRTSAAYFVAAMKVDWSSAVLVH